MQKGSNMRKATQNIYLQQNARCRTLYSYNLDLYKEAEVAGKYNMPVVQSVGYVPDKLIGFNSAISSKEHDATIHFYLDDYQIERVWRQPIRYMELIRKYKATLMPDFSMYRDMPYSMKIWNNYRSKLLAQIWQKTGILVIPTVRFGDVDTYEYCFDGMPEGGTYAVSCQSCKADKEAQRIWHQGMDRWMEEKRPENIIIYGPEIEYDFKSAKVHRFSNNALQSMSTRITM